MFAAAATFGQVLVTSAILIEVFRSSRVEADWDRLQDAADSLTHTGFDPECFSLQRARLQRCLLQSFLSLHNPTVL